MGGGLMGGGLMGGVVMGGGGDIGMVTVLKETLKVALH